MKLLSQKVALVTGGTRGIGKAIAEKFLEQGVSLALFGTNEIVGKEVEKALNRADQKVVFYKVNVGNTKEVDEAIAKVLQDFGKIDILVNNAGITRDNLLMKLSEEDWDSVITTNLKSLYNTCHAVIRPMMKARNGKIINVTSVVGLMGNPGQTNYSASKAGILGFSKSLAKEVGSRNIQINCIAPGFIETQMTQELPEDRKKLFLEAIPLQRFGKSEDIANAALFLASSLSDYMTGQVLVVDGGMVMH